MARTATKTATNTGAAEEKKSVAADKENEKLKKQLAEAEKKMSELMAQMQVLMNANSAPAPADKKERRIKFINMTMGGFTIKGTRFYHLDKQFDSRIVSESEARVIVNNMPRSITSGLLYIADADFVKECELDYVYESLLDDNTLRDLLNSKAADVCEVYRNAGDEQKAIIVDMIEGKRLNGEPIDANILVEISKLCGKDLMSITPDEEE